MQCTLERYYKNYILVAIVIDEQMISFKAVAENMECYNGAPKQKRFYRIAGFFAGSSSPLPKNFGLKSLNILQTGLCI